MQGMQFPIQPQAFTAGQQFAQAYAQHYQQQVQNNSQSAQSDQLRLFWQQQMSEIEHVHADPSEFKNHQLPLARIKKVGTWELRLLLNP
jgi:hypothetical protein